MASLGAQPVRSTSAKAAAACLRLGAVRSSKPCMLPLLSESSLPFRIARAAKLVVLVQLARQLPATQAVHRLGGRLNARVHQYDSFAENCRVESSLHDSLFGFGAFYSLPGRPWSRGLPSRTDIFLSSRGIMMSMSTAPIEIIGARGEHMFRRFADAEGIPYLWIDQRRETLPEYLRALERDGDYRGKRPDAVAASLRDDVVLIDVKHRRLYADSNAPYFTLDREDAGRLLTTEQLLGKRVLLVYRDNADADGAWYARFLSEALQDETTQKRRDFYRLRADRFGPLIEHLETGRFSAAQLQKNLFS